MLGADAVSTHKDLLQDALGDESQNVRIVAAQALALHDNKELRTKALQTLASLASPKTNGVLTAMPALAAIESLGEIGVPLHVEIAKFDPHGASPDKRYDEYPARLIANLISIEKPEPATRNK